MSGNDRERLKCDMLRLERPLEQILVGERYGSVVLDSKLCLLTLGSKDTDHPAKMVLMQADYAERMKPLARSWNRNGSRPRNPTRLAQDLLRTCTFLVYQSFVESWSSLALLLLLLKTSACPSVQTLSPYHSLPPISLSHRSLPYTVGDIHFITVTKRFNTSIPHLKASATNISIGQNSSCLRSLPFPVTQAGCGKSF